MIGVYKTIRIDRYLDLLGFLQVYVRLATWIERNHTPIKHL
jgi:hypothetical protein